jgi:hypothetical protein
MRKLRLREVSCPRLHGICGWDLNPDMDDAKIIFFLWHHTDSVPTIWGSNSTAVQKRERLSSGVIFRSSGRYHLWTGYRDQILLPSETKWVTKRVAVSLWISRFPTCKRQCLALPCRENAHTVLLPVVAYSMRHIYYYKTVVLKLSYA